MTLKTKILLETSRITKQDIPYTAGPKREGMTFSRMINMMISMQNKINTKYQFFFCFVLEFFFFFNNNSNNNKNNKKR